MPKFKLVAKVSTDSPDKIKPVLLRLLPNGTVKRGSDASEFLVEAEVEGTSARDVNRSLLSALRAVEKRTRLRAEWASGGTTERFFDYVPKGVSKQ